MAYKYHLMKLTKKTFKKNMVGAVLCAAVLFVSVFSFATDINTISYVSPSVPSSESASKSISRSTRARKWKPEYLLDGKTPDIREEIKKRYAILLCIVPYPGRDARKRIDAIKGIVKEKNGQVNVSLKGHKGLRLMCPIRENWESASALEFDIALDEGFPEFVQTMVYLKDGDHCWYEAKLIRKPVAGGKMRFTAPFGNVELWQNSGHGKPINGYSFLDVREFGIGLFSEEQMTGNVSLGNIALVPRIENSEPLCVTEFREPLRSVGRYEIFEAQFQINRVFDNPFDPEQVDVCAEITSPAGVKWRVAGFFTQDFSRKEVYGREQLIAVGRPYWAVRAAPREAGVHTYQLTVKTPSETFTMKPREFIATPSERKGYVRVSQADPTFWEFENGDIFYPVGHSVHASYDEHYHTMQKMPKPVFDPKTFFYDRAFLKMGENGENFTEIWMCPWWMEMEWRKEWHPFKGLGRYNLENAWRLDYLFNLAERYDIYLQIALMNHGEMSYTNSDPDWQNSPFFTQNGGFLRRPEQFFTNEKAQKLWRQKLRYIVARWGGSTNLFGWVLISESDLIGPWGWSKNAKEYFNWCLATSRYLKTLEPVSHPVTNHYYGNYSHLDKNLFRQPEMGYMAADAYRESSHLIDQLMGTVGLQQQIQKPIIVSEYGGDWCGATDNNLTAEQQGGIWAAYMIGMTSTPLFWWFEFVDQHDLYGTYKGFSKFIAGEDRRGKPATTQRLSAVLQKDIGTPVHCLARVGDGWGDAWIFEEKGLPYIDYYQSKNAFYAEGKVIEKPWTFKTISDATVTLSGFAPGSYIAEYWHTLSGEIVAKNPVTVGEDNKLILKPPTFTRDIAVKVRLVE